MSGNSPLAMKNIPCGMINSNAWSARCKLPSQKHSSNPRPHRILHILVSDIVGIKSFKPIITQMLESVRTEYWKSHGKPRGHFPEIVTIKYCGLDRSATRHSCLTFRLHTSIHVSLRIHRYPEQTEITERTNTSPRTQSFRIKEIVDFELMLRLIQIFEKTQFTPQLAAS